MLSLTWRATPLSVEGRCLDLSSILATLLQCADRESYITVPMRTRHYFTEVAVAVAASGVPRGISDNKAVIWLVEGCHEL